MPALKRASMKMLSLGNLPDCDIRRLVAARLGTLRPPASLARATGAAPRRRMRNGESGELVDGVPVGEGGWTPERWSPNRGPTREGAASACGDRGPARRTDTDTTTRTECFSNVRQWSCHHKTWGPAGAGPHARVWPGLRVDPRPVDSRNLVRRGECLGPRREVGVEESEDGQDHQQDGGEVGDSRGLAGLVAKLAETV